MKLLPLHFSCGRSLEQKGKQKVLIRSTCQHTNRCSLPASQSLKPPRDSMQFLLLKTRQNPEVPPSCLRGAEKDIDRLILKFLSARWKASFWPICLCSRLCLWTRNGNKCFRCPWGCTSTYVTQRVVDKRTGRSRRVHPGIKIHLTLCGCSAVTYTLWR